MPRDGPARDRHPLVALTLVLVGTLLGDGLYRYERVRLGFVSDEK